MDPESPFAFCQTWMAVVGAMVIVVAVVHKRRYFRTGASTSLMARILIVGALYFIPAAVGCLFVVGFGMRMLADRGLPVSGAGIVSTLAVLVIANLLLRDEIEAARKLPPRW